jgi:hypothetical protein
VARLDLDAVRPDDHEVVHLGKTYIVPGDVPVDTIIDVMKMTGQLQNAEQAEYLAKRDLGLWERRQDGKKLVDITTEENDERHEIQGRVNEAEQMQAEAIESMRDIVLDLFRMREQEHDVAGLRLSPDEVSLILGLVTGGETAPEGEKPKKVEDVLKNDLSGGETGEVAEDGSAHPTPAKRSRSKKPSPARSSA